MRPKTLRQYKRAMHEYGMGFGFRTPYQIIVDGDFCHQALKYKMNLNEELTKTLLGLTKPLITGCTIKELRGLGKDYAQTVFDVKQYELRRCRHFNAVSSAECIAEMIGQKNSHHYGVASQNLELRKQFRKVPGVPLLHIKQGLIILEPMSDVSKEFIQKLEQSKLLPPEKETARLRGAKMVDGLIPDPNTSIPPPRKKKVKEPNPLSVKKKIKKTEKANKVSDSDTKPRLGKRKHSEDTKTNASQGDGEAPAKKIRRRHKKKPTADTSS